MATTKNTDPFQSSTLKRRNSMNTPLLPTALLLPNKQQSTSFPLTKLDLELFSLKPQPYTSLKDLLPSLSAVQSPPGVSITQSMHEIPIRNHLVKQAAWAYLQPMSSSPDCSTKNSFRRMWASFSTDYFKTPFKACFLFLRSSIMPTITGVFDRLLGALRVRINMRSLFRAALRDRAISDSGARFSEWKRSTFSDFGSSTASVFGSGDTLK